MTDIFDNLDFPEDDELTGTKKEKLKLDMFKDVLPSIGQNDYDYYGNLSPELAKLYQPYVIMKWMSNSPGDTHRDFLQNINDFVNVDFWSCTQHPELQHMLMCIANQLSSGTKNTRHNWVPFLKTNKKKSTISNFFRTIDKNLNDQEIDIIKSSYTNVTFEKMLKSRGFQDTELKQIMKAWKDETK